MNIVAFTGRTTKDVEIRYTKSSNPMAIGRFSLAVDDGFGDQKKTYFFNFTAFGKTAESLEKYVKKGTKIVATGKATQNQWTDKQGNKRSDVAFILQNWEFAESRTEQAAAAPQPQVDSEGFMQIPDGLDEDLPFV